MALGPYSKEIGLDETDIEDDCNKFTGGSVIVKKGLALELFLHSKLKYQNFIEKCALWFSNISNTHIDHISKSALKASLYSLLNKKKKAGGSEAKVLLQKNFIIPTCTVPTSTESTPLESSETTTPTQTPPSYQMKLLKRKLDRANTKISGCKKLKENIQEKEKDLAKIRMDAQKARKENEQLKTDKVILKQSVKDMKKEIKGKDKVIEGLQWEKEKVEGYLVDSADMLEEAKGEVESTHATLANMEIDNDYLQSLLHSSDEKTISTFSEENNCYSTEFTNCVMDLLDNNVAAGKIGQIIQSVCKFCGKQPSKLPSRQTVNRMNDQRLCVAQRQLEDIADKDNLTLYSDETSKYGRSFEVFAISDSDKNTYMLGLREMSNKSASTVCETFKEILEDINGINDGTETGHRILAHVKNTMSDRAATEKKFHKLLEGYRLDVLPHVKKDWERMNQEEQAVCGRLNNFFCGLHILVNFAEVCSEALKKFERLKLGRKEEDDGDKESDGEFKRDESGTVRLIRTASKAFCRGGDERNGVHGPFKTFVESKRDKVSFVRFQHNRFNILFVLGEITFHHRENMKEFLENVHGPSNRLLKAVLSDLKIPTYVAGCRALGIISKYVTGPLWRVVESNSHILEMAETFSNLVDFFEKGKSDASDIFTTNTFTFPNTEVGGGPVDELLKRDEQLDPITTEILQCLFEAMFHLLKRQASDHLSGGKYFTADSDVWEESRSTIKHNKLPEFFFGQLDFLMKYRPNASILCNEAFLMFSHNKTSQWLASMDPDLRHNILTEARKEGRNLRSKFQERIKAIEDKRRETLRQKEQELKEKKERLFHKKEKMTSDILYFGLWQSEDDIENHVQEIKTATEKIKAVKAQLTFRRKVLHQISDKKDIFLFSIGKKKKTLIELLENLKVLVNEARRGTMTEASRREQPLLVNKSVKHKFDDMWYLGTVLSVVPGFSEWYNVKYRDDPAVYVYKLQEDYAAGDLVVVPSQVHTELLLLQLMRTLIMENQSDNG